MIKGKLSLTKPEDIGNPKIAHALNILSNTEFSAVEGGRTDISDDMYMVVFEYITEIDSERSAEAHKNYIDVQYIISGEERVGIGKPSKNSIIAQDYDEEKDTELYSEIENEEFIELKKGMFAVFFPEDIHRTGCNLEKQKTVRKAVIKVRV